MHGRPRKAPKSEDAAASAAASAAKAAGLRELQSQLLHNHRNRIYSNEALLTSSKLLEINPDIITAWNYRKLAVQHNLDGVSDPEGIKSAVEEELRVSEMALRRNPKAYGAWYHRKWLLSRGLSPVDFDREFRLLDKLLMADARNFHGWNYRRFVAKLKNVRDEEELNFTMNLIDTNFSNYSAWHNRSILLSRLLKQKADGFDEKKNILEEEYDLVRQALFTDPSDQSGWFYHIWLLDQTLHEDAPKLISSWPAHGSVLFLSAADKMAKCKLLPSPNTASYHMLHRGAFPIILCFDKAIRNVNSSTITVSCTFSTNEELIWKPVSIGNSGEARFWVTFVNIPDKNCGTSSICSVEVDLGQSKDVILANDSGRTYPLQCTFTVILGEKVEEESIDELFVWDINTGHQALECPEATPFEQLRINEDHVLESSKWKIETLSNAIDLFKSAEEDSKFVKLTLARLLVANDALVSTTIPQVAKNMHSEEVLKLYEELMKLDPPHKRYYEDERSLVLIHQLTCDNESLTKRYHHFDDSCISRFSHHNCLLLNNLSLTRIGFTERLLWVQVLDLSCNKLRSTSGLEHLQLLVCLNLSNNQISSFTALEQLKRLSFLRVLDISFNEIGAHPIDTTRYLCSSPLSHSLNKDDQQTGDWNGVRIGDCWEMMLLFKALQLTQLDIKGNVITLEDFPALAMKMLPTLIWLDGQRLR